MTTVGAVIDRLFRTYLEPPDAQPANAVLSAGITASATSLTISQFMVPEDETLMSKGVVLELGSELIFVGAYDTNTKTASSLVRGYGGTTATSHASGDLAVLSPSFPRQSVFDAVADNILTLHPDLFTVRILETSTVNAYVAPMNDPLAVSVIEAFGEGLHPTGMAGRMVDYHPEVGGRAVVFNVPVGNVWIRYRRRMGDAQAESDTLEDLGVEQRWVNVVIAGAAADLFAGRDLPASQTDWISAGIEAQSIRVGTRASLATALARYRELLMDRAKQEMRNEYRPTVTMRPVGQTIVRPGIG